MSTTGNILGTGAGQELLLDGHAAHKKVAAINAKATGQTAIFTAQAGRGNFIVTQLILEVTAADTVTGQPTVSLGTTAVEGYVSVLGAAATVGLTEVGYMVVRPVTGGLAVADGETLYVNISAAATGTTLTLKAHVFGFYS